MNIYLSGPMRGIFAYNFPAFMSVTAKLRAKGHVVFNPAEEDLKILGLDANETDSKVIENAVTTRIIAREVLRADLTWICTYADAIAMLPGWQKSKGALAEWHTAKAIGLETMYVNS